MKNMLIALRNLNRQKRRSFLLGGAIAFGILVITLINGFTGSFVRNVSDNFSHLLGGQIFIDGIEKSSSGRRVSIIRDDTILMQAIQEAKIPAKYISKVSTFSGTLIFQTNTIGQQVVGVDWQSTNNYVADRLTLVSGNFKNMDNPDGIIISEKIAKKLNVQVGDTILAKLQTVTGQLNVGEFQVAAISFDPGLFGSIAAYANLAYVNTLLNIPEGEYQTLGIFLEDMNGMDPDAARLYADLQGKVQLFKRTEAAQSSNPFEAMQRQVQDETWTGTKYRLYTLNDRLSELKQIVGTLNTAGLIILLVLLVVIMVGITNTFRMIMYERIREIGTMRALGMQRPTVRNLFLLEALFLAIGGTLTGLAASGIVMAILHLINWGMNTPFFLLLKDGHMTFAPSALQLIGNLLIVALLTLLAASFPASRAAKLNPADALRAVR
ncbi:MAG TPA: FtsX-like permease family protein [Spirochaetia bacterium]|nr:FtsX-like permease family protein [Spirochaetia bacterium]